MKNNQLKIGFNRIIEYSKDPERIDNKHDENKRAILDILSFIENTNVELYELKESIIHNKLEVKLLKITRVGTSTHLFNYSRKLK